MGWWLLRSLLLFSQRLLQAHTLPGVVLPVQKLLLVDELGTLGVNQLLPEVFILQELQHVQAMRVSAVKDNRGFTLSVSADSQSTVYNLAWTTSKVHLKCLIGFIILCEAFQAWQSHVSVNHILQELGIFRLFPVEQIF